MKKFLIKEICNFTYYLTDKEKTYSLKLEFYDLNKDPQVGDVIIINEELLKENILLSFGALNSEYGKNIKDSHDKDLMVLIVGNKKIYLKRLYG